MDYIPNIISGLRILLIPIFALFLINNDYLIALYIFLIMGITDALDGSIARYLQCETLLGAYLDAVADKVMINTAFILLCHMDILPYYVFSIVLTRDLIILIGIILNNKIYARHYMKPIFLSKINTFMQIILVLFCMFFLNNLVNLDYIQDIINVVVLTTILSAVEYIYNYKKDILLEKCELMNNYEPINNTLPKKY